jgi:hypothetical protein
MKRIFALICTLFLIFSVACSDSFDDNTNLGYANRSVFEQSWKKTIHVGEGAVEDHLLNTRETVLSAIGLNKSDLNRNDVEVVGIPIYTMTLQDYQSLTDKSYLDTLMTLSVAKAFYYVTLKGAVILVSEVAYKDNQWQQLRNFGLPQTDVATRVLKALQEKRSIFLLSIGEEHSSGRSLISYFVEESAGKLTDFETGVGLMMTLTSTKPKEGDIL